MGIREIGLSNRTHIGAKYQIGGAAMEVKLTNTGEYLILKLEPLEAISLHKALNNVDNTYLKQYDIDFLKQIIKELKYFVD